MFSGLMNSERLIRIYEAGLIPFLNERFTGGHRLYQDNDLKHSSVAVELYFEEKESTGGPPLLNPQISTPSKMSEAR